MGVAVIVSAGVIQVSGGDDVIAEALQREDRCRLRSGRPFGVADQSADGTRAYVPVSRPVSESDRARMDGRRPDELIRPIPRHLVPLPTPRRTLEQVRARANHYYLLPSLETPYKDGEEQWDYNQAKRES